MDGEPSLHLLSKQLPEMRARLDSIMAKAPRGQPATGAPPTAWWKQAENTQGLTVVVLMLLALVVLKQLGLPNALIAMTLAAPTPPEPLVERPATIIQALLMEAREHTKQEEAAHFFVDHEDELEGHVRRRALQASGGGVPLWVGQALASDRRGGRKLKRSIAGGGSR